MLDILHKVRHFSRYLRVCFSSVPILARNSGFGRDFGEFYDFKLAFGAKSTDSPADVVSREKKLS
jgi:hypothetical protein